MALACPGQAKERPSRDRGVGNPAPVFFEGSKKLFFYFVFGRLNNRFLSDEFETATLIFELEHYDSQKETGVTRHRMA